MKIIKILPVFIFVVLGACLLTGCSFKQDVSLDKGIAVPSLETPNRPADVNGLVRLIEGNEILIANELKTQTLTDEEREAQKIERQAMTQEERQALKTQEAENLETENVTLVIPVGVPIIKGSGEADGANILSELTEIKVGTYVSIWLNDGQPEVVKLKGTN